VAIIQHGKLISVKTLREMIDEEQDQTLVIEVDRANEAKATLSHLVSSQDITVGNQTLHLSNISREQIPGLTEQLVQAGIKIYGIRSEMKTLEEKFLEMTGGGHIA
jgi:ABC-2 type transport system ATP-binding protein